MKEPEKKVDSSWKEQVEKERTGKRSDDKEQKPVEEIKSSAVEPETESKPETKTKQQTGRAPLGKPEFTSLVTQLAMQAMYSLGLVEMPGGERPQADLEQAQYLIDLLAIIEQKTTGNLTDDEQKVLIETLDQLRMAFVAVTNNK
ncbi:MAG: DUF1844 domain-containing protein [Candidatus Hydrogenedentes bacterium]|nr:DUF1844 domain-containing protein [Candidatus Hydrogenedentota bacterium]